MTLQNFYEKVKEIVFGFGKSPKIFQNERQLQFDLAWQIHAELNMEVRFEVRFNGDEKNKYVDLIVVDGNQFFAIELKYKTDRATVGGITLQRHSAGDLGCYDYWSDVERLENLKSKTCTIDQVKNLTYAGGLVLMISNDAWYWNQHQNVKTQYYNFRLTDGREINPGDYEWQIDKSEKDAFQKQQPTRSKKITFNKKYTVKWEPYYTYKNDGKGKEFKYMLLMVEPNGLI